MEDSAYMVELVAGLLYLPAAFLLLRLASRTGELPERLLGLTFACMGSSYLLYQAPYLPGLESFELHLSVAGRLVYGASCIVIAVFTREVFRPRERWAGAAVWACAGLFLVGFAIGCATGDAAGFSLENPGFWLEWVALMMPALWLTAEGLIHHRSARRRLRIGLSDPHVCNRFLLWGLFGAFQLGAGFVVLGMNAAYAAAGEVSAAMDVLLGGVEIASLTMVWLAFAPPAFYRRWIEYLAAADAQQA